MGLIKRAGASVIIACAAVLSAGAPASAAVTIGQVAPSSGALQNCSGTTDLVQPSVTAGGNLYSARAAGTITSWSTRAATGGDSYTLKVFRRTTDPDVFRVIVHSGPHTLSAGLNTFSANLTVSSGDLVGMNASGIGNNNCRFGSAGDFVLARAGSLSDGSPGAFSPAGAFMNSRLNLSAILIPSNAFSFGTVSRDRRKGTATVEVSVSNPGSVTLSGKGLKAKRATKTVAVARAVRFGIAVTGKRKRKLDRKGRVSLQVNATFTPTGGDPAVQSIRLKLKKKK